MRADDDLVVIARRSFVAAASVNHGDTAAVLLFHISVREAELAEKFDAPDLEPHQVVCVIHDSHLIGFGVAHANGGLRNTYVQFPLQFGLRFSRNDATPS